MTRHALFVLFLLPACLWARPERLLDFQSDINVGTDAVLTITETIRVEAAGDQIKHGIYRDFPQLYRGPWGLRRKTGFAIVDVRRDGHAEPFHTGKRDNGQRVYFGQANVVLPPGSYTYTFTYRTDRQLGFFDAFNELYWNVTGNGWVFPIEHASAMVHLPPGGTATLCKAYTGRSGEHGSDYTASLPGSGEASFATTRSLLPHEGLTIVVQWPKGFVTPAQASTGWKRIATDNPGLALAVLGLALVLIYYGLVWAAVGKDPAPGQIIPLYGPPKGFSPAGVRYLKHMHFDDKAFTAAIISLGVSGALTIREEHKEYTLTRESAPKRPPFPEEQAMFNKFFSAGHTLALKQTNHTRIGEARKALQTALRTALEKVYFVRNVKYWVVGLLFSLVPMAVSLADAREIGGGVFLLAWLSGWSLGVTALVSSAVSAWRSRHWGQAAFLSLFSLPFVAGEIVGLTGLVLATSVWVALVFIVGVTMNGVFYHLLKAPTLAGRRILDQIDGFKMYLRVAERDRLNFANLPERTPELFDKFLPYAVALDVEQDWAKQFEGVLAVAGREGGTAGYSPAWYAGTALTTAGLAGFTANLGGSFSGAISSAATAPGSSSGGGGGGGSGGGGGGGGGGGW